MRFHAPALRFAAACWLAGLALLAPEQGRAEGAGRWVEGVHSRAKLVAGGPAEGGALLAAIVIGLDPGYKTYWRHPGESGLPPAFDWSRSTNLAGVEVLWPAPARFDDASGTSYGYAGRAVFPLRVTPASPAEPVRLALQVDYGVCKDLCIPARAALALDLPGRAAEPDLVRDALARVPQPRPLGAETAPAILGLVPSDADGKPALEVAVAAPAGSKPRLFVEAPDGWYLAARETPRAAGPGPERQAFLVDILERPKQASGPIELRLTLVAGETAIETTASLDLGPAPR